MARTMQPPSRDVPAVFPPLAEKSEERSGTRWARIPAERLAAACGALVGNGWEFDSAFAYREGPSAKAQPAVAYLFRAPQSRGRIVLYSIGNRFPSVSSTLRVASWDERKMAETHGITFDGLSDSRPLLSHPENWAAGSFASAVEENRKQTPSLPGEPKG